MKHLKWILIQLYPGHGPIKKKNEAIEPMMNYFDRLIKEVRKFHKTGKTLEKRPKSGCFRKQRKMVTI